MGGIFSFSYNKKEEKNGVFVGLLCLAPLGTEAFGFKEIFLYSRRGNFSSVSSTGTLGSAAAEKEGRD